MHFSPEGRHVLHEPHNLNLSHTAIAQRPDCNPSTIGRELGRNSHQERHQPDEAHQLAFGRHCQPRHARSQSHTVLVGQVAAWLKTGWLPQIAVNRLIQHYPRNHAMRRHITVVDKIKK